MHFLDVIIKKRNGCRLSSNEIDFFISGYIAGRIPDYQVAALLMAIWFSGMDETETYDLTAAMCHSGDTIDLSAIPGIKADKHSTGGVADTTTLICAPLAAACGLNIAKMSGRGLGHTGGTIDKLESIPGLSTSISMERFIRIVSECGLSVIGQTEKLVPADKLLYALRDVTGTIDNTSLIAASIMSKKLALGSDVIVLDVKTGSGAFMTRLEDAGKLAQSMVAIGKKAGKRITALVTDMNQPLGNAIGNALEVQEAIEILQGNHPGDLKDLSVALTARMLLIGGFFPDDDAAVQKVFQVLDSGQALQKLEQMIAAQGGNPGVCQNTALLPRADRKIPVTADQGGYIHHLATDQIGSTARLLGAGRTRKTDPIDPAVGIQMNVRLGDYVGAGDPLAQFHVNDPRNLGPAIDKFKQAVDIKAYPLSEKTPLILDTIE